MTRREWYRVEQGFGAAVALGAWYPGVALISFIVQTVVGLVTVWDGHRRAVGEDA